jgi:branched-chain amino acid transport system permease protein
MNKLSLKYSRVLSITGLIACLAVIPILVTRTDVVNLLVLVLVFVIIAESWNLLAGYAGQINLGHAAFFGLGSLTARILWLSGWLPLPFSILAGGMASSLFALIVGGPTLRFKGPYFVFGTFALAEIGRIIVTNMFPGLSTIKGERILAYSIVPRYYVTLIVAIMTVTVVYLIANSRLGVGIKSVREDETAAQASGINTFRCKLFAFVVSATLAGLAGGCFAYYHISYHHFYTFSPLWTFDAMFITFIGGIGTIIGPIVGAVFYVVVREQLALIAGMEELHLIIFGVLFIIVVLLMPKGLFEPLERFRRFLLSSIAPR